jgi:hypothetical protein
VRSRVSFAPAQFFRVTICKVLISALGQKQTFRLFIAMSALPPKADIVERQLDVRFVPIADISRFIRSPRRQWRECQAEW